MLTAHSARRTVFSLAIVVAIAAPALAADEPRTGAGVTEVRGNTATAEVRRAPRTPEDQALHEVREATALRVKELVSAMDGLKDGPALHALQRKVVELKREGDLEFLRTKVRFARRRGDLAAAQQLEMRIDAIVHPQMRRPAAPVQRAAPGAAVDEGVRR